MEEKDWMATAPTEEKDWLEELETEMDMDDTVDGYWPEEMNIEFPEEYEDGEGVEGKWTNEISIQKNRKVRKRKKKEGERIKHYERGYRSTLIRLLLMAGAVTYSGLHLLPGNRLMYTRKLREMEKEEVVKLFYNNHKKIARLQFFDDFHKEYTDMLPEGYYEYFNTYSRSNQQKISSTEKNGVSADRIIKYCEIVEMMYGAEIGTFPEDKTNLLEDGCISKDTSSYYTMMELRCCDAFELHFKPNEDKKVSSRALGLLISPGGKYVVYHTGSTAMFWSESAEGQMQHYISKFVNYKCEIPNMVGEAEECIIIGDDMEVFVKIFESKKSRSINITNGYKKKYAIPYDRNGLEMIKRMTKPEWKEELNRTVLTGYTLCTEQPSISIDCDGFTANQFALNFCDGNIVRLNKYINFATWDRLKYQQKFEIYCYPFQTAFLKAVLKPEADIKIIEV